MNAAFDQSTLRQIDLPHLDWCAVNSKPRAEWWADENLRQQNFATMYPQMLREIRHARRVTTKRYPYFPGYLFVGIPPDMNVGWAINKISNTYGVHRVLHLTPERPFLLPSRVICELMAKGRQDSEGGWIMAGPPIPSNCAMFRVGETVRVCSGPFSGFNGDIRELLDKKGAASVLIDIFGRKTPTELGFDQIERL